MEFSWRVATEPSLVIGHPTGAFAGDLDNIRDVAQLSDGGIAIADGAQRILVFGSDASYLRTIGRRGQGPGEFTSLAALQILDGDTILAHDSQQRRASLFERDGALIETIVLRRCCNLLGRAQDGTLVFAEQVLTAIRAGSSTPGISRSGWVLLHLDAQGEVLDTIAIVPGSELLVTGVERVNILGAFLRDTYFAFGPDEVFVATGDRFEVTAIGTREPHPARTLRPPSSPPPRPVEPSDVHAWVFYDAFLDEIMAAVPSDHPIPLTQRVLHDDVGWVWVEHYAPDGDAPRTWSALDLDSEAIFDVAMPPRFTPFQIGENFILGVARDSLDVEWAHMYALAREP